MVRSEFIGSRVIWKVKVCIMGVSTQNDPHHYKDLIPSFSNILTQVITRKLSADFDYHGVPAPWVQIRLLRSVP